MASRSVLAIKWICRRVIVPGLVIVETSTIAGEVAAPGVTLFVLPNPIQVITVDKAIGLTVELYTIQ